MKDILYCVGMLVVIGVVVAYLVTHKPALARNEANGKTEPRRFGGYKASLKTTINQGTPIYGEAVNGWTTSTFRN